MQIMSESEQKELSETGKLRLVDPRDNSSYVAVKESEFAELHEEKQLRTAFLASINAWDQDPDPHRGAYNDLRRQ